MSLEPNYDYINSCVNNIVDDINDTIEEEKIVSKLKIINIIKKLDITDRKFINYILDKVITVLKEKNINIVSNKPNEIIEIEDNYINYDRLLYKDIRKYEVLTDEVIRKLIKEAQNGDKDAIDKILLHNTRLILRIAKKIYRNIYEDIPIVTEYDLFSEGVFGLYKAIKYFNLTRTEKFSTYAGKCIYNKIREAINNTYGYFIIPRKIKKIKQKIEKIKTEALKTNGKNLTIKELSTLTNIDEKTIISIQEIPLYPISLENPIYGEDVNDDRILMDTISHNNCLWDNHYDQYDYIDSKLTKESQAKRAKQLIGDLPEEEKELLCLHYYKGIPQSKIAEERHVSRAHINNEIRNSIQKVKSLDEIYRSWNC